MSSFEIQTMFGLGRGFAGAAGRRRPERWRHRADAPAALRTALAPPATATEQHRRRGCAAALRGRASRQNRAGALRPRRVHTETRMKTRAVALTILLALAAAPARAQTRPNVVLIYADDLGYGDVSAYGARRLQTPNIDRLAREGLRFTDAHAAAATCTPSRYAMLTGEYAWRKAGTGILPGNAGADHRAGPADAARACSSGPATRPASSASGISAWDRAGGPDWNGEIRPGPLDIGFDSAFIMAATGDRAIACRPSTSRTGASPASIAARSDPRELYTAARRLADRPRQPRSARAAPSHGHDQTIVNGISRIGYMTGGKAALWRDQDMADTFTRKATAFIEQHRAKPFFLFFAPHDPHVPRVPHPRFAGATTMGPRGDAIAQLDWSVGEVLGDARPAELDPTTPSSSSRATTAR